MRLAYKVWSGIAAGVFGMVALVDVSGGAAPQPAAVTAPAVVTPPAGVVLPAGGPAAEAVAGLTVIDGDTFRLADGRSVRVLGIDSCEAATLGGQRATADARSRLLAGAVTLTREPGVDLDRYGRLLRYVAVDGADFAEAMVRADHTAIYTGGRNDASAQRQAGLRALDANGRTCDAAPAPATTTRSTPVPGADVDRPATRAPVLPAPAAPRRTTQAAGAPFKNCAEARAAGVTNITPAHPRWQPKLDGNGDGVGCET